MTTLEKTLGDNTDLDIQDEEKKNEIIRGVLSVVVIAAEDLPKVDLIGKADPFVVLTLKKSGAKQKTRVSFASILFYISLN